MPNSFQVRLRTLGRLYADARSQYRPANGLHQISVNVYVGLKRAAECVRLLIELSYRPDFHSAHSSSLIAQEVNERAGELVTSGPHLRFGSTGIWIASAHFEPAAINTAIYPSDGGEPHKILDIFTYNISWAPDGRSLLYLDRKNPLNISSQTVDGGPSKQLTDFKSDRIFFFALSRDGEQLALARGNANRNVVLISNFKPQQ